MSKKYKYHWEDPEIIEINKLKGRASTTVFNSDNKLSLNGLWKFKWRKDLTGFNEDSEIKEDVSLWDVIEVPSLWQLKGYGTPYYLAFDYPPGISKKKSKIPSIDHRENEVGIYSKSFLLPEKWMQQKVLIYFGAVKSAFHLYINGKRVGYSQGSMTPSEFDITSYIKDGLNKVDVVVYRYSDGTYLEDQDMWFLSGIYRDVYLYCQPRINIFDFFAFPTLDENYKDGAVNLKVDISLEDDYHKEVTLDIILKEWGSEETIAWHSHFLTGEKGINQHFFELKVNNPKKWSAEYPNLYELVLTIKKGEGEVLEKKKTRFGFRTVEIKDEKILINGSPIIFKGVNRHDFDPDHGWAVPKERYYQDLYIMKQNNINAIRCSHYPNAEIFYELCDELGFYVMDEADLETHAVRRKNVPGDNPLWTKAVVDRMERMVLTNRNHPSIVMWSLGNEAGEGSNFIKMKEAAQKLDSTRPFHYEGDYHISLSDVLSRMYPTPQCLEKLGQYQEIKVNFYENIMNKLAQDNKSLKPEQYRGKPVVVCEYAHAMENSLGNFHKFIEVFDKYDNMAGGFIWDFVDQSIRVMDGDTEKWLYGGDFNEKKSHRYYCANGIINADRKPQPSLFEVKKCYQNIKILSDEPKSGKFKIINKHSFANLREFNLNWSIKNEGYLIKEGRLELDLQPHQSRDIALDFEDIEFIESKEYVISFSLTLKDDKPWGKAGDEIAWEEFIIGDYSSSKAEPHGQSPKKLETLERDNQLIVTAHNNYKFIINLKNASIECIDYGDGNILKDPLKVNYWRALTDNDKGLGNFTPQFEKLLVDYSWKKATYNHRASLSKIDDRADYLKISFKIKHKNFSKNMVEFKIHSSGQIDVLNHLTPKKDMIRIGFQAQIIKDYNWFSWYGKGPHENYIDRNHGAKTDRHSMDISQLYHLYMRPQENGNRTNIRWLEVENKEGLGIRVDDIKGDFLNFSAWPFSQNDLEEATHIHKLKLRDFITLNIDLKQRGVGGDAPGVAMLHDEYKIPKNKDYRVAFSLKPIHFS